MKKFSSLMIMTAFFALSSLPIQAKDSTTIRLVKIEAVYDEHDDDDTEDIPTARTGDFIDTDKLVVTATYRIKENGTSYDNEVVLKPSQYELSTKTVIKGLRDVEVTYTYKGKEKKDTFKLRGKGEVSNPRFESTSTGKWYMISTNGSMLKDTKQKIDGDVYLFDENGYLLSGWQLFENRWYYFDESDYTALCGWQNLDSTVYYFDDECAMVTNYWAYHEGDWYYFGTSGLRTSGWNYTGGEWYYMNEDYTMHTGWLLEKSKWYYLESSGEMVTGWKEIDGKWYYFNSNGVMAVNTYVNEYYVDDNGVWVP